MLSHPELDLLIFCNVSFALGTMLLTQLFVHIFPTNRPFANKRVGKDGSATPIHILLVHIVIVGVVQCAVFIPTPFLLLTSPSS